MSLNFLQTILYVYHKRYQKSFQQSCPCTPRILAASRQLTIHNPLRTGGRKGSNSTTLLGILQQKRGPHAGHPVAVVVEVRTFPVEGDNPVVDNLLVGNPAEDNLLEIGNPAAEGNLEVDNPAEGNLVEDIRHHHSPAAGELRQVACRRRSRP